MGRGPVGAPAIIRYVNNSVSEVDSVSASAGLTDDMVLIKTLTASSSATLDFVHGSSDVVLDSTYPIYLFKCINIHPASDNQKFNVNFTTDGTNWNVTKTTSLFRAQHDEADTDTSLAYDSGDDIAQGTGDQMLNTEIGADNDQCSSGELWLFNPSSTTFVKHFMSNFNGVMNIDYSNQDMMAGYCNTTSAVTGARFLFASGNIDAGTIKLYGIKDS